jgi:hypothetical protein
MFFAASPRLLVVARVVPRRLANGRPKTLLFLLRVRATPAATPATPVPAAINGILNFLAADVTVLPTVLAPLAVASFAASREPWLSDERGLVRAEDALGRVLLCGVLAFWDRLALERDFAAVRPFAEEFRLFDRLPGLAVDLLLVCGAMWKLSPP